MTQGDTIWVFPSSEVPYILRPAGDGKWELVGQAYVHGIMTGNLAINQESRKEGSNCVAAADH
ncbi:MAG: hypothetical protein ACJ788_03505 [Ktedonobacteraceae bacterium]